MATTSTRRKPAAAKKTRVKKKAHETFSAHLFDARPDRLDLRDLPYRPPLRSLPSRCPDDATLARLLPRYVKAGLVLNQGSEGACTGFGLACVANYLLFVRHLEQKQRGRFVSVSARMLYELARRYDEWPGEQYDGSSCRGAIKGWHKHGVCSGEHWPYEFDRQGKTVFVPPRKNWELDAASRTLGVYYRIARDSVVDLQAAIAEIGAVYVSARVHDGWTALATAKDTSAPTRHDELPRIKPPTSSARGGHAFALVGFNAHGFIVQNSWGAAWGAGGFALLGYEDWVAHATDAWACALGVPARPSAARLRALRWPTPSGQALTSLSAAASSPRNPADDPWPINHVFIHRDYEPWATHQAYEHTLVTDNDGGIAVRDFTRNSEAGAADYAAEILCEAPWRYFRQQKEGSLKLALYAHGGLNDETESIRRIRVLGPCFAANGIYPLFLTWKTGPGETLRSIVQDWSRKVFGDDEALAGSLASELGEMRDRAVEVTARLFGRGVWSEMRENAARGQRPGHGLDQLARQLLALQARAKAAGRPLEIHLIGHSAGSILLGHLLERWLAEDLKPRAPRLAGVTLYAAACSMRFAVERYLRAADEGLLAIEQIRLCHLSDRNEKADALPTPALQAYGKSLLYLVSRALDDERKQPLLGMERALLPEYASKKSEQWAREELQFVRAWQRRWPAAAGTVVTEPTVRTTQRGDRVAATHRSFDNNIDLIGETLMRIRGAPLVAPLENLDY